MKTTELIVELLVIGMGTLISLMMIIYLFGIEPEFKHSIKIPTFYILPVLVLSYVFGILTDRISDLFYSPIESKIRDNILKPEAFKYQQIRTTVYDSSPSLYEWFVYSRTRIRIVRGWSLNFAVMFIALIIAALNKNISFSATICFLLIFFLSCSILSIYSYCKLLKSEYLRLKHTYSDIKDSKKNTPSKTP